MAPGASWWKSWWSPVRFSTDWEEQWLPVTDEYKPGEIVIVSYIDNDEGNKLTDTAYRNKSGVWCYSHYDDLKLNGKVYAWRPMPKPM